MKAVKALKNGRSYVQPVSEESVAEEVKARSLSAATDFARLRKVQL
jgi:UDP-N-acetyl-D-mannosaminuronate dehydrogenase